ncbi:VPLPA-CTERM sorting domain-containing protein [Hyphococcus luteus]|uniref:Ice-binding protein C-terminal domain-containing protein n=1 Tax=Hyphococcus luteus TaxID=2058213 RepID=A0A2S7K9D1_9PROT|nr:VPLPA-CTERM sorting domain-containing protein [Marinicaulis flavus]PQA89116.1 hypothetical protein CW354_03990 [Marinicaulis flavus]
MIKKLVSIAAATAALGYGAANAAAVNCSDGTPDVSGNVTPTSACQYSNSATNDSEAVVNSEMFFGYDDWTFDAKDEADNGFGAVDEGPDTVGLIIEGDSEFGSWELTGLSSLDGLDVMLVFKDGQTALPGVVVAYLVSSLSGEYTSPFYKATGALKDISHISVYLRDSVSEVPLPAAAWLMIAGLGGLGFAGRRKKAA